MTFQNNIIINCKINIKKALSPNPISIFKTKNQKNALQSKLPRLYSMQQEMYYLFLRFGTNRLFLPSEGL